MGKTDAIIIFAKAPVAGQVKTRLQPHLSADECATLYASFIIDTVRLAMKIKSATIMVACHPSIEYPFFQNISDDFGISLIAQHGKDIGMRMGNCINYFLGIGYRKTLIIGSDSPDLPPEYIQDGFECLDSSDMVVGPASDGGYYLIGGRRVLPVFDGIPWSSSRVFETTIKIAEKQGITYSILDEWYDVDTLDDLQRLQTSIIKRSCPVASLKHSS